MDPNACYERFRVAYLRANRDDIAEAWHDLNDWIERGGFEPDWTAAERRRFYAVRIARPE